MKVDMSSVFGWLKLVRLYSLYKILYPKRKISSYSILGTIVSPNKILLTWGLGFRAEGCALLVPKPYSSFSSTLAWGRVHLGHIASIAGWTCI